MTKEKKPVAEEGSKRERVGLNLTLAPSEGSEQPVLANVSRVSLAPGLAYIDFGFIEPGVVAALTRAARSGEKMPAAINGRLAVRVAMGLDTLSQLQAQLAGAIRDLRASMQAAAQAKGAAKSGS